ncbi:Ig-like domain-containing protein [Rheinheimera sp.]|uniref:Ig-like domain-containing protein n=1 Tax=Rheinheimera sp. TaxID=1869214 RepID=UPI00273688F4|nr:putative Ig domain-containing protein [Rheinheimera sp.]MDP2716707.1 putative Ig domain-containing protein [Rheinheimera sp.]
MRKTFLAGVFLAVSSVQAEQLVTPLYDSSSYLPSKEYLSEPISFQTAAQLDEGILAYAHNVARGDKVTAVASYQGIAIYATKDGQYQLVREVSHAELGLDTQTSVEQLEVSATDSWVLMLTNGVVTLIPLDQQYQPDLTALSSVNTGYGRIVISNSGLVVLNSGYNITTYIVAPNNGKLTLLSTLQLAEYAENIALANNLLLVSKSSWQNANENLVVYKLDNGQWQYADGHNMTHNSTSYQSVSYMAVNPSGNRIVYGGNNVSYVLNLDLASMQLSEENSGNNLFSSYFDQLYFVDDTTLLLRNYNQLRLHNSSDLQQLAIADFNNEINNINNVSVSRNAITLLTDTGLLQLDTDTLAVQTRLLPGEQDVVLAFDQSNGVIPLDNDYLLQRHNQLFRLYKLNQQGIPELVQLATASELLGYDDHQSTIISRKLADGLFAIFQSHRYSVLQLNSQTDQLQWLSSGILTDYNGSSLYTNSRNLASVGTDLLISRNNTLNLFRLGQNNQFSLVNTVADGVSGVSGIARIQLLLAIENNIYTVNSQEQIISHFTIVDANLQQNRQYHGFSLPAPDSYYLHNDLLTLSNGNYLQSYRVAPSGELTLLSNQYLQTDFARAVRVGERFAASYDGHGLHLIEQDSNSGIWSDSLDISSQQLYDDYQLSSIMLLPLAGNLGIYDAQNRRLIRFAHNSAPYVSDAAQLQLLLNQGQPYQLTLSTVVRDEEDATLSFSLQNAVPGVSISDDGQLTVNEQQSAPGSFDVLAADPAGLVSRASFNFSLNMAPVAKATLPVFSTTAGDAIQFELAQHFTDPEGQALQFALASTQAGLTLSSTGLLTGTLSSAGEFSLSVNISDSTGAVSNHTVQISVAAKPEQSSGGSLHWLLLSLLACTALCRVTSRR